MSCHPFTEENSESQISQVSHWGGISFDSSLQLLCIFFLTTKGGIWIVTKLIQELMTKVGDKRFSFLPISSLFIPGLFFALIPTFLTNSGGNACNAGYEAIRFFFFLSSIFSHTILWKSVGHYNQTCIWRPLLANSWSTDRLIQVWQFLGLVTEEKTKKMKMVSKPNIHHTTNWT